MAMLDLSGDHKFCLIKLESDINVYNFGGSKVVQGYCCESGIVITHTVYKIYIGTEETAQRKTISPAVKRQVIFCWDM